MALCGVFSIGYGVPCLNTGDAGSTIGAFWYRITQSHLWTDILMRGTVGIMACVALLPLGFIGVWWKYGIACLMILGGYVLFGALITGEPVIRFKLKGKHYELLTEDMMIYAIIAWAVVFVC